MDYLREFERIPSDKQETWFGRRSRLVSTYSWAVPSKAAIDRLVELSPLVELGAGSGYWAYEIARRGGEVYTYDIDPPENQWVPVTQGDEKVLEGHTEPLLLSWPPFATSMGANALKHYSGNTVIYIGEIRGCTGDKNFHDILEEEYVLEEVIDIPQYVGVRDNVYIFRKP